MEAIGVEEAIEVFEVLVTDSILVGILIPFFSINIKGVVVNWVLPNKGNIGNFLKIQLKSKYIKLRLTEF